MTIDHCRQLECPCCHRADIDDRLIKALIQLDRITLSGFRINSGFRCPKHNAAVGGAPNSDHLEGRAADIAPTDLTMFNLVILALTIPTFASGAFGFYPTKGIIHLGVRTRPASWGFDGQRYTNVWTEWNKTYPTLELPHVPCTLCNRPGAPSGQRSPSSQG